MLDPLTAPPEEFPADAAAVGTAGPAGADGEDPEPGSRCQYRGTVARTTCECDASHDYHDGDNTEILTIS